MNIERESRRWLDEGIIDATQRERILALYANSGDVGMAALALVWTGGVLLFLGIAFLVGMFWEVLGPARAGVLVLACLGFSATGQWLRRHRPALERTGMALVMIGGLLLPAALGVSYDELFGSTGHPLPLVIFCGLVYAAVMVSLRSRGFAVLLAVACFFAGVEIVRDQETWGMLFPLVQLGVVSSLEDVFGVVFLTLGGALALVGVGAGRFSSMDRLGTLRTTLVVCGYLVGLGPALVAALLDDGFSLNMIMALGATLAAMAVAVATRVRAAFWVGGASLVVVMLIVFAEVFEDSVAFTLFAIFLGAVTLVIGSVVAVKKPAFMERWFGDPV